MKKIIIFFIVLLLCTCNEVKVNYSLESSDVDNKWLEYQQKLHGLLSLKEDYEKACRISIIPAANAFPATILTVWNDGTNDLIYVTSTFGVQGFFSSEGKRISENEVVHDFEDIKNCYLQQIEEPSTISIITIEKKDGDTYLHNYYSFEDNRSCIIKTYQYIEEIFPDYKVYFPKHILIEE